MQMNSHERQRHLPLQNSAEGHSAEFRKRGFAAVAFVFFCFSILAARFVWLQVIRHDQYTTQAEKNRTVSIPSPASRGLILDRNGVVLARNYWSYSLEITPSKTEEKLNTLIERVSQVVRISEQDQKRFRRLLSESKKFDPVPLRQDLSEEEMARFWYSNGSFREWRLPTGSSGSTLSEPLARIC